MDYKVSFTLNNVKDGQGNLQMRVRWKSNTLGLNVGYIVNADKWDRDAQQCRNNTTHGKKKVSAAEINKAIRRYQSAVDSASNAFLPTYAPTIPELRSAINVALGREEKTASVTATSVEPVICQFIIKESRLNSWSENTAKKFRTLRNTIKEWREDATLADFDAQGLESFYIFLLDEGLTNYTVDKYITNLKQFLTWVSKQKEYTISEDFKTFSPRIKLTPKTIVWFEWDDVLKIHNADISKILKRKYVASDSAVRDIFCFSCFTGMRFSDIHNLRHSDIYGGKIHVGSIIKTADAVTIELNKYAQEILLRYKDADPEFALPRTCDQVCNRTIKDICKALGLDTPTTISYYKGSELIQETHPKYELITMHTGRRTFISNALTKGISPVVVMQWTGHKDYEEMRPYITISDKAKETAMKLFDV